MKQVHNGTMMQYFEWYLKPNSALWKKAMKQARELSKIGITALWLPPAYKGAQGAYDVGYTVYDLYDLGEFNQKGSIATKYGTKDEYLKAIKTLKKYNINVYADVSLDHKIGADETEEVEAIEEDYYNRERDISGTEKIMAWTKFNFPGRNNKYSDFKWNASHFDGVDYDDRTKRNSIFRFKDKKWDDYVDTENGNFDLIESHQNNIAPGDGIHFLEKPINTQYVKLKGGPTWSGGNCLAFYYVKFFGLIGSPKSSKKVECSCHKSYGMKKNIINILLLVYS